MRSLSEIRRITNKLARKINPPDSVMPTFDNNRNDGTPNIKVSDSFYYYQTLERDAGLTRQTNNLAKLLYWAFEDITSSMAYDYAANHRDIKKDWRRVAFEYQLNLLEKINSEWRKIREEEIAEILQDSPYQD